MANKIIKYNLNSDGTIPTYVADAAYGTRQSSE